MPRRPTLMDMLRTARVVGTDVASFALELATSPPGAIPRPFLSFFNNEVARTPFYGAQLAAAGHLHLDRNDEAQWRASVARGAALVREGRCFLVSPEGTRSRDGRLLPMKRGAFIFAVASQRPIVCVTVLGGHDRMPRGSPIVRAGPVRVVFSEPIPTESHRVDDLAPLQAEVVATFERAMGASGGHGARRHGA